MDNHVCHGGMGCNGADCACPCHFGRHAEQKRPAAMEVSEGSEAEGVTAIIFLQSLAGIVETKEQATAGWRAMRDDERETTLRVYRLMKDAKPATRSLSAIAKEIRQDWKKVYFGAMPYLWAMADLNSIDGMYGADSAREIVNYFLANANSWRGDVARRVKAELKAMVGR